MRFMIVVEATKESDAEIVPNPGEELMAAMAAYHEELANAGALLDASGLHPSSKGWRITYAADGLFQQPQDNEEEVPC